MPKMFFSRYDFLMIFVRIFIRAPFCTFLSEKSPSFGLFSKSRSKKYSLYTVSICIFDVKILFLRYDFLMTFCSILHQSTIVHPFGENSASFSLFSKGCSKKYSLYTVSICIFVGKIVFSRYDCLMTFCSILYPSTIVHLFGWKTA